MSLSKTIKVFNFYVKDAFKELNHNLGLYLLYIVLLSLANAIPGLMATFFDNSNVMIQLFAKVVFSIIPLLVLSKIIYVVKIRSGSLGEYRSTFLSFLVYSLLFLLLMFILGGFAVMPVYLTFVMSLNKWLLVVSALANVILLYCSIYFALTPLVAAIENEDPTENFFIRSKALTKKNVLLIVILQAMYLIFYLPSLALVLLKDSPYIYGLTLAFSVMDAVATIMLTLVAVKIYFYLTTLD